MEKEKENVVFRVRRDNIELSYSPSGEWKVIEHRQTKKGEYRSVSYFPYLDMALRKIIGIKATGLKNNSNNQGEDLKAFEEMLNVLNGIYNRLNKVHVLTPAKAVNAVMG